MKIVFTPNRHVYYQNSLIIRTHNNWKFWIGFYSTRNESWLCSDSYHNSTIIHAGFWYIQLNVYFGKHLSRLASTKAAGVV